MVQIDIIPEKAMVSFIEEKMLTAREEVVKLKPIQEKLKREHDSLEVFYKFAEFKFDLHERIFTVTGKYDKEAYKSKKELTKEKIRFETKRDEYMKVLSQYLSFSKGSYFIAGIPEAAQTTKTNSDGAFVVRLKQGKYALVAHTTRKISDSTEEYYWLVWLSVTQGMQNKILLSNDSLLETNCKDCVVRLSEIPY
ncbi:MAG: hypothetical protein HY707_08570 [Ignavibacteriae bacterium]|nr:hypothetical protein [Ignavibacteriota bacterium]